jgi:hypothetical protein
MYKWNSSILFISFPFRVETINKWDIHSFAFTNHEKKFVVLAEGDRGPLIIEYPNIIATLFLVSKKFP